MRAADLPVSDRVRLVSGSSFWRTEAVNGLPSVVMSDGPHGLRLQADDSDQLGLGGSVPATCFPTASALANSWDTELVAQVGAAIGAEARAAGVGLVLGPGMNIKRHPLGGRNFEYFSEDPLLTGHLAAAMVRGIQNQGVGACVKHFAVNNQEDHRFVVDAVVDERTLREIYLAGFEFAIREASPWAVMCAYNLVNGSYGSDNRRLLTDILRDEWGFDGFVVSDWGATNDRVAGLRAGMDLEMPGGADAFDAEVLAAIADGSLPLAALDRCADRVIEFVQRCPESVGPEVAWHEHDDLARRAAACGSVLLLNDGLLPLAEPTSLGVIGAFAREPRFQGSGSSLVNAVKVTSAAQSLEDRGIAFEYAPGYHADGSSSPPRMIDDAVKVAKRVETVLLMVGLPGQFESEGFDREHMSLPADQEALIEAVCRANPRTVVAVSAGAPITMPWVQEPAAILSSYLGGQASGAGLVDVLLGDAEPEGRLAESFPIRQSDVAADPYFPGQPHQVQYREGLAVGYRHGFEPLFCFGHGLGYTQFDIGQSSAPIHAKAGESVTVTVPVVNGGKRPGSTVVQIYLHDRTGAVSRPRRTLAGFAKVRLNPGERTSVEVDIPARVFAFFDVGSGTWKTPSGQFDLQIGRSSSDIVGSVTIDMAGDFDGVADQSALIAGTDAEFERRMGRPVPPPRTTRPFTRNSTIEEISATVVGRAVRQVVLRVSGYQKQPDPVAAKMILRSVDELPLRAVALFGQGKVTMAMIDGLVDLLNRRPDRPLRALGIRVVQTLRKTVNRG